MKKRHGFGVGVLEGRDEEREKKEKKKKDDMKKRRGSGVGLWVCLK